MFNVQIVNWSDPNWWQARKINSKERPGLIPTQELEERRRSFVTQQQLQQREQPDQQGAPPDQHHLRPLFPLLPLQLLPLTFALTKTQDCCGIPKVRIIRSRPRAPPASRSLRSKVKYTLGFDECVLDDDAQGHGRKSKTGYSVRQNVDFDAAELTVYEAVEKMPPFSRKTLVLVGASAIDKSGLIARLVDHNPDLFGTVVPCKAKLCLNTITIFMYVLYVIHILCI